MGIDVGTSTDNGGGTTGVTCKGVQIGTWDVAVNYFKQLLKSTTLTQILLVESGS